LARNMWTLWLNQLEKTRCKRFLFVLNDKSAENRMELQQLVHKTFNYKIELETVPQSPDVLGRQVADTRDSFYLPPAVFWAVRD